MLRRAQLTMGASLLAEGPLCPSMPLFTTMSLFYTTKPRNEERNRVHGARWAETQRTSCKRGARLRAVRPETSLLPR
jgi:hypothetical protein